MRCTYTVQYSLGLVPRPFEEPGTHCVRMRWGTIATFVYPCTLNVLCHDSCLPFFLPRASCIPCTLNDVEIHIVKTFIYLYYSTAVNNTTIFDPLLIKKWSSSLDKVWLVLIEHQDYEDHCHRCDTGLPRLALFKLTSCTK